MIKRAGATILTMLYLLTAIGFALNLHYCFNRVTAVNLNTPVKSCGMVAGRKMKCCHDQHFQVKVSDAHQGKIATGLTALAGYQIAGPFFSSFFLSPRLHPANKSFNNHTPDPPLGKVVTYIKNCVFRV